MVSPVLVQRAAVAKLKADVALTAITTDIRESFWQGQVFTYPNVRVHIPSQTPVSNGNCYTTRSLLMLELFGFDESPSSEGCQEVLFLAFNVFFGNLLTDPAWRTLRFMSEAGPEGRVRVSPRVWRARTSLSTELYEVV